MKRLLHLMNYAPLGTRSFDYFILEYAKQARERGWDVTFGFNAAPPKDFVCLAASIVYDPKSFAGLESVCRPVDVLQTSFHSVFERPLLRLKRTSFAKRLVVIDHSSGEGPSPTGWKSWLRRMRGARVGRIVDAIVCVSEFNRRRDIERVFLPADKVHVVPNGIELTRFPFHERTRVDGLKIVYAGQLISEKGVQTLLEAMRILEADPEHESEVLIAGLGSQRNELEHGRPDFATRVRFLGYVADVPRLFAEADIVVVPSLWAEAFGLVVIEAMACGAAVVASDAGALPEVVGDAGMIFRKGDAGDLAVKLYSLIVNADERIRLGRVGRQRVEEHYQLHDCVRRHLDIVEEIHDGC